MPEYQTHEHDVLVIGAGGAGLRAAIEAAALSRPLFTVGSSCVVWILSLKIPF